MKKIIVFLLLIFLLFSPAIAITTEADQFDIQIKNLYLNPDVNSPVVFNIPVDIYFLALSPDKTWCKIRIGFNFLGRHDYVGWAKLK